MAQKHFSWVQSRFMENFLCLILRDYLSFNGTHAILARLCCQRFPYSQHSKFG